MNKKEKIDPIERLKERFGSMPKNPQSDRRLGSRVVKELNPKKGGK